MADNATLITGLFPGRDSAEQAYQHVLDRGYHRDDIDVVMSDDTRQREFDGEGAGTAPLGGPLGFVAAALAAAGTSLGAPGLTLVMSGPLVGIGSTGTGLADALSSWNIPEERVEQYELGIREGGLLLGLRAHSAAEAVAIETQWRDAGGTGVHH